MKRLNDLMRRGMGAATLLLTLATVACDESISGPELVSDDAVAFSEAFHAKGGQTGKPTKTTQTVETTRTTSTVETATVGTTTVNPGLTAVKRKWPIDRDITRSAVIGPDGGMIVIMETGFTLTIPPGALSQNTEISVTAIAGDNEEYVFGPHGIHFDAPVTLEFSTESVKVAKRLVQEAAGVYLGDGETVLEAFALDQAGLFVSFETNHFSRYALAFFGGYALAW